MEITKNLLRTQKCKISTFKKVAKKDTRQKRKSCQLSGRKDINRLELLNEKFKNTAKVGLVPGKSTADFC